MKHLLKMSDLTPAEVAHILDVADELKARQKAGGTEPLLKGKSVALMFSKNSTRTRTSFEVGVYQLGGLGNYMNAATELQSGFAAFRRVLVSWKPAKSRRRLSLSVVPGAAVFQMAVTTASASRTPSAGSSSRRKALPYLWANISTSAAGR